MVRERAKAPYTIIIAVCRPRSLTPKVGGVSDHGVESPNNRRKLRNGVERQFDEAGGGVGVPGFFEGVFVGGVWVQGGADGKVRLESLTVDQ